LRVRDRASKLLPHRVTAAAVLAVCWCGIGAAFAQVAVPPTIVIGFVGGRVHADNGVHLEVRMAEKLRTMHPRDAVIQVFANHQGDEAFKEVMRRVDTNHDGIISREERAAARIVIYGHSWGASQTVTLAQQLDREKIPVLLTVQVDSVAKSNEIDGGNIPGNVAQAINFYQTRGMLRGRSAIQAMEPLKTKILGNIHLDYRGHKIDCHKFPWFARTFMLPHIEIENDARVWDRIEAMIEERISGREAPATVASAQTRPAAIPAQ
jgi:hypothetical protein